MTRVGRPALLLALLLALLFLWPLGGQAVQPDEVLADPVLEGRARELSKLVRCVVCQNESIDTSNAELARDLRLLVRERLTAGDSDQQVLDYLVARYGEFVLLRPRVRPGTYLLWFGPLLVLGLGALAILLAHRRRRAGAAATDDSLSRDERTRLSRLMDEDGGDPTQDPGISSFKDQQR